MSTIIRESKSFEGSSRGLMGRRHSRDYSWDEWRYGRKKIVCETCKKQVLETHSIDGMCFYCYAMQYLKKTRQEKKDKDDEGLYSGRKVRL